MPLSIVKSVLVTGAPDQENERIKVTVYDDRSNQEHQFVVTTVDLTGNEVRSAIAWRFVIDNNESKNNNLLERIRRRRSEHLAMIAASWASEKDPSMVKLINGSLERPPIFYLDAIGKFPICLVEGMSATIHDHTCDHFTVMDVVGRVTNLDYG